MNRTLNQLINQLHLDPKKEAAVRKLVENAGSNKEVSGGGGPVIIEIDSDNADSTPITDEQINAAKNGNIKIKVISQEENMTIFFTPTNYFIKNDSIIMNSPSTDVQYEIDIVNKIFNILVS